MLYINWIDIESECWWIICYCWDMLNWKWKCIMWLLCEWLLRSDEMESEYVELFGFGWLVDNWLICVCGWEWYECAICWVEKWDENWDVELLMMKEWFELLRLWIWNVLNWIELMNYVNCLCLMVMSWLFKWLINMW